MKVILFMLVTLLCSQVSKSQTVFDYYVSNNGNDSSAGTSALQPKKTITGVMALLQNGALPFHSLKLGFKNGDVFNETFAPGFPINAGTYFPPGNGKKFAVFNGTSNFDTGWVKSDTALNIYEQVVPLIGYTGYGIGAIGQYSFVSVLEIDRELEKTAPITARRLLKFCNTPEAADLSPGSFYEPLVENVNALKISIHTSDGSSPNNNPRYRYEVTVRDRAFNSTYQQNNNFERMWVGGYGAGNGMIPSGAGSTFNRMIFGPAAGIHHLGLRGATINNSLFLPAAANTSAYAVVFYDVEGFGRHNSIKNSIFLDLRYPMYSHNSYGSSFGALELDNVIAFADTTEGISFMEVANTDSAMLNNVYAYGFNNGYNYGHTPNFSAKNSSFVDVVAGVSFGSENRLATINNCFIKTRSSNKSTGVNLGSSSKLLLSNTIIHLKNYNNTLSTNYAAVFIDGAGGVGNRVEANENIFIADVAPAKNVLAVSGSATSTACQNNVYILLKGNSIVWRVKKDNTPGSPLIKVTFQEWQQRTGNDSKSLFFDLRKDSRGLKAIFVDPDNGDYSLANTFEANRVKELRAGMIKSINCFLKKPSYEAAANIIMNDAVLSANVCRSACVQNSIRINHHFKESLLGSKMVKLEWGMEGEEQGIDHYEILRSFGNNDFINIGFKSATGLANYSFVDSSVKPGIVYNYSVAVVTTAGEKCYSQILTISPKELKPLSVYPNPSSGQFMVSLADFTGPIGITVTNVQGIKVYGKEATYFYNVPVNIDLTGLAKGVY